jgi:homogentisate 1,2-dioxygenase
VADDGEDRPAETRVTEYAANLAGRQENYLDCWRGLKRQFVS